MVKTTVERKNDPQSNWTGSYKYSRALESWTYSSHVRQYHSTCSAQRARLLSDAACAKDKKQQFIQNWFQLSGSSSFYHPVLQFLSLPTSLSLSLSLSIIPVAMCPPPTYLCQSLSSQMLTWKEQYAENKACSTLLPVGAHRLSMSW